MKFANPAFSGEEKPNLAAMIDVVFLLLIYFMVVTTIVKQEADIGIQLPGVESEGAVLPVEHVVAILEDGQVLSNEQLVDTPSDIEMPQLTLLLKRLKASSDLARLKTLVTISPEDATRYGRSIAVLNACSAAGIQSVTFVAPRES